MTIGEKIYSAFVILAAGFFLLSLASFHFVIIPACHDVVGIYFVVAVLWIVFVSLAATIALNLYYRQLLVIPTIVQIVVLCFAVYPIPVGIAGAVLLYRRVKMSNQT